MNHTLTTAAVLGASAITTALILSSPSTAGPLNPPPGPVTETSPDLNEINQRLQGIELGLAAAGLNGSFADFKSVFVPPASAPLNTTVPVIQGTVFIRSIILSVGQFELYDGQNNLITTLSAAATQGGSGLMGGVQFDLGLIVEGPVSVRRTSNFDINPTLIYAELPSP